MKYFLSISYVKRSWLYNIILYIYIYLFIIYIISLYIYLVLVILCVCVCVCVCLFSLKEFLLSEIWCQRYGFRFWSPRLSCGHCRDVYVNFLHLRFWIYHISPPKMKLRCSTELKRRWFYIWHHVKMDKRIYICWTFYENMRKIRRLL